MTETYFRNALKYYASLQLNLEDGTNLENCPETPEDITEDIIALSDKILAQISTQLDKLYETDEILFQQIQISIDINRESSIEDIVKRAIELNLLEK